MSRTLNLVVDGETAQAIDELKKKLAARDDAHLVQRSIAIAQFASQHVDAEGELTILSSDGEQYRLNIQA